MFRLLKERPLGILSMLKMRINRMAPEPGILAMTIHTGSTGKERKQFKLTDYLITARLEIPYNVASPSLSYGHNPIRLLIR